MTATLMDGYDAALFDLDGVVYLGPVAVPGAAEGLAELRKRGARIGFVTNNAARSPQTVVDHLGELGIDAALTDVVVSSQAAARLLAERVPAGSPVLVVGTEALVEQIEGVGLRVVEEGERPAAVIQGYHPDLPWQLINRACYAIEDGAPWVATNTDSTRPTDLGLVPGAGAQIAAVRMTVGIDPVVAGKPFSPLLEETVRRLSAARPIFVGDRIDTDIDGAATLGMDSLFVFSGAHGKRDVIAAANRPTHVGLDLRALVGPVGETAVGERMASSGEACVRLDDAGWNITAPHDAEGQLAAFRALLALVPAGADPTEPALALALDQLDLLP
ncbi:HAD-IIA family hydrolase [Granulicoccus sp. GXG6511]|uniref:HAD-IIA family hydrolase n=1 Tax=Granulicoccus sp. GXG6511 TaxID=3381351 RepID=UPI003D7DD0D6